MKFRFSSAPAWLLFLMSILPALLGQFGNKSWSISLIAMVIFFALWAYAIAKALTARSCVVPAQNFSRFKGALIFVSVYLTSLSLYFFVAGMENDDPGWIIAVILVGNFVLLYWFIYLLAFVAKAIATVALGRPVGFAEYAGYFFCLFFFPIGIWWVNREIRRALRGAKTGGESPTF